jgi:uncharacterized membrane protein
MKRAQPWLVTVIVGAVIGIVFAGISSYDFVQHLDRQVHSLHCSFIPGGTHAGNDSGCQAAMMSSYSSVFRTKLWGGLPISLPAMSVFAFLLFYAVDLLVTRRKDDPRATGFLALATALPALASVIMLTISLTKLGTVCKLCVCIYTASALCAIGAIVLWRRAVALGGVPLPRAKPRKRPEGSDPAWTSSAGEPESASEPVRAASAPAASMGFLGAMFAVGCAFVAVPVILYFAMAPDHSRFVGTCESLPKPDDTYGIMVPLGTHAASAAPAIEVLDPLCPACKAFEERLDKAGMAEDLDRKAVLFPLDNTCNWMVTEATHPGACTVSEAILCAQQKGRAADVIAWAFDVQDRVRAEAKTDPTAAARLVKERFPELAACVGSPEAKARLNKSMRWVVANNIRVLTPQLYIDKVKLCDEDVDLGLEYTLSVMLARHASHTLVPATAEHP